VIFVHFQYIGQGHWDCIQWNCVWQDSVGGHKETNSSRKTSYCTSTATIWRWLSVQEWTVSKSMLYFVYRPLILVNANLILWNLGAR